MIGLSLPYSWLLGDGRMAPPDILLPLLKKRGARSVEIRTVPACADSDKVLLAANILWDHGFNITVHGSVGSAEEAIDQVLSPLAQLLANMRQRELVVTIHPIRGDNVRMLLNLSDYINENGLPVKIALENERKMPDKTDGDSLSLVLDAVKKVNRKSKTLDEIETAFYNKRLTKSKQHSIINLR